MEWCAYLLAFGAKEAAILYPLAVALHSIVVEKKRDKSIAWLFLPATVFGLLHLFVIPHPPNDLYRVVIDGQLLHTTWTYIRWALGTSRISKIIVALGLLCYLWQARHTRLLFFVGWFGIFLLPVLPLPNHLMEYYLTLPLVGLCWMGGAAIVSAERWRTRALVVAVVGAYLIDRALIVQDGTSFVLHQTSRMRIAYRAMEQTSREFPGTTLFLHGVDNELFQSGFQENPFALLGVSHAYLTPGADRDVTPRADLSMDSFRIPATQALVLVESGKARALDFFNDAPVDVTEPYKSVLRAIANGEGNWTVVLGSPEDAGKLGPGWYPIENGFRWMGKSASVRMRVGQRLHLAGFAPDAVVQNGLVELTITAAGKTIGSARVAKAGPLALDFPLASAGSGEVEIQLAVDRTLRPPGEPRELGLIFSTLESR